MSAFIRTEEYDKIKNGENIEIVVEAMNREPMMALIGPVKKADENYNLVGVTRCKDCKYYISAEDMKNDFTYDDYKNELGHDGLCKNTDKWTDKTDFCSDGKRKEG